MLLCSKCKNCILGDYYFGPIPKRCPTCHEPMEVNDWTEIYTLLDLPE